MILHRFASAVGALDSDTLRQFNGHAESLGDALRGYLEVAEDHTRALNNFRDR